MTKLANIVVMITLTIFTNGNNSEEVGCEKGRYSGPYMLKQDMKPTMIIGHSKVSAILEKYPENVEGIIVYRYRYTSHCFTNLLGEMSCNTKLSEEHPQIKEAKEWALSSKCMTGKVCPPSWGCWGSDAQACLGQPTYNQPGRPDFIYKTPPMPVKLYHSCTQDWRCGVHMSKFPIHIKITNGTTQVCTSDTHGNEIVINSNTIQEGHHIVDEAMIYFLQDPLTPVVVSSDTTCSSSDPSNILCTSSIQYEDRNQTLIIEIDPKTFTGVQLNYRISITSPIESISGNQIISLTKSKGNSFQTQYDHASPDKAASIEDILEQLNLIKIVQMQTLYNFMQFSKSDTQVKTNMNLLIESLSKIDDQLICKMKRAQCRSKWLNELFFNLYPCNYKWGPIDSNCYMNMIYRNGRFTKKKKEESCFSINLQKVETINPWTDLSIDTSTFNTLEPESAATDWEGWSWLNEQHQKTFGFEDKFTSNSSFTQLIDNMKKWPYNLIYQWFLSISSAVGWFSLLLHLFKK